MIDDEYRPGMSKAEAKAFALKLVSHAMFRDASSGGMIRMIDITEQGVTRELFTYDDL